LAQAIVPQAFLRRPFSLAFSADGGQKDASESQEVPGVGDDSRSSRSLC